jgi:hypothetical protein
MPKSRHVGPRQANKRGNENPPERHYAIPEDLIVDRSVSDADVGMREIDEKGVGPRHAEVKEPAEEG